MTMSSSAGAEGEFLDVVRLWRLAPGAYTREVIHAATECLVAGLDTEGLRELAGASPRDSRFVLDPLIVKTIEELGLSDALEPDVQLSAMRVLARRLTFGRMSSHRGRTRTSATTAESSAGRSSTSMTCTTRRSTWNSTKQSSMPWCGGRQTLCSPALRRRAFP